MSSGYKSGSQGDRNHEQWSRQSTVIAVNRTRIAWVRAAQSGALLLIAGLALSGLPLYFYLHHHILNVEDDAYYYFVIARNIYETGVSSFDQQTLTNGYQPLWLLVLLAQYALAGTFDTTLIIELALVLCGLTFLLSAQRSKRWSDQSLLTFAFVASVAGFTMNGMEGSLLVFCLSALYWVLQRLNLRDDKIAVFVGVLGALAVGARIDAGVFVLPLIAMVMPTGRAKLISLGVIGLVGLIYMSANLAFFGSPVPISAAVKSLGGIHFNRHLYDDFKAQIFDTTFLEGVDCVIDSSCGNSDYFRVVLIIPIALAVLYFGKPAGFARYLLSSFLIGIGAYALKLFFGSSWSIWPWYFFPMFIGTYALIRCVPTMIRRLKNPWSRLGIRYGLVIGAALLTLIPAESYVRMPPNYDWQGFAVINTRAIKKFGPVLAGGRVAMGDRSGSFAYGYSGPVTQLEGLVEDAEYLHLIRSRGDLKGLLCRRGVKFIAAYALDLKNYETYAVNALRSWLTSFSGPSIVVRKSDEVGRIFDLDAFDSADLGDEGDSYLYLWRLSGCPGATH